MTESNEDPTGDDPAEQSNEAPPPPPPPPTPSDAASIAPPEQPPPPPGEPPRVALGSDGAFQYQPAASQESWFSRLPTRAKIGVPIVAVLLFIGWFTSRGQTDAEDLGPGDCFEVPSAGEFSEVTDQDCDGPHEAEVLAVVNLPAGTPWPGAGDFETFATIDEACFTAIDTLTLTEGNIPADAELGYFFADRSGWDSSGREVLCYVSSPSGELPGRVLAE